MIGIYKITNLINGKSYIGQSTDILKRWAQHKTDTFRKTSDCYERPLYRSIRKNGLQNFSFEIIEFCEPDELNEREVYWIAYYDTYKNKDKGYNLTAGGNEPIKIIPKELYELWDKGYTVNELTAHFNVNSSTITKWLKEYKNYSIKESYRRSALKVNKDSIHFGQKIIQYSLEGEEIKRWDSIRSALKELHLEHLGDGISKCLKGEYFSSGGFRWGYENEELLSLNDIKHKAKGCIYTDEQIEKVKQLLSQGIKQTEISVITGVEYKSITKINTGKRWNDGGVYPIYDSKKKKSNR